MRDPDLVQRAEQAATALEQAWTRWRARHGLGSGPPPPVSSYVGYSVDEPWGQPRVVLGVEAAEAERLAAILDGHDCAEPSRAEPAGLPRQRQPADLDPVPAMTGPVAAPAEPPGDIGARLKDLAARVTALHPRSEAREQHEPEPTQSGLADTAV